MTYLKNNARITALIGAGAAARIYTDDAKQGVALPYITMEIFSSRSEEWLEGISGLATNRIEINCYAATYEKAYELAEEVRLAPLQHYKGRMGATWVDSVTAFDGYETLIDRPTAGANQRRYRVLRDFMVTYEEAKVIS